MHFFRTLVELRKKWIGPSQCLCKNVSHIFTNNTIRIIRFTVVHLSLFVIAVLSSKIHHVVDETGKPVQLEGSEFLSLHV